MLQRASSSPHILSPKLNNSSSSTSPSINNFSPPLKQSPREVSSPLTLSLPNTSLNSSPSNGRVGNNNSSPNQLLTKGRSLSIAPPDNTSKRLRSSTTFSLHHNTTSENPQSPTSPQTPSTISSSFSIAVQRSEDNTSNTASKVVSERRGSLHLDLDKLDEWLQPDEVLRPTMSILSPKPKLSDLSSTPPSQISPITKPRSFSLSRGESFSKIERLCTSPTFSPKTSSPLSRELQQDAAGTV